MWAGLRKIWWAFGFPMVISSVLLSLDEKSIIVIYKPWFFVIAFVMYFSGMIGWMAIQEKGG